jgi:hypothetical protein
MVANIPLTVTSAIPVEQWTFIQASGVFLVAAVSALLVYTLGAGSRW